MLNTIEFPLFSLIINVLDLYTVYRILFYIQIFLVENTIYNLLFKYL